MKCHICNTQTIETTVKVMNEELKAIKCPKCNTEDTVYFEPDVADRYLEIYSHEKY